MTTELFDPSVPAHAKALEKLERDLIVWFTTVRANGEPHAVPVWFWWHEGRLLVFSEPTTAKVAHVRRGSPVLVHLQGDRFGEEVVVMNGRAEISERPAAEWLAAFRDAYEAKYADAIRDYGMGLDDIAAKFDTVIVFTPDRLMAW
ncbi:pyridoxamine 5'-phosphate oxidase family protein [Agromyces sp. G08B096]|uniref:Pyridoxamine 5'-phosphate oxidase family protein n=1 Tax=Agromyces sp. G08B096 TaxID=3156399 RepID=A0AAU7W9E7_9MICO